MLNRVVLIGRLTRDPELRRTASNLAVVSFTIAVDDSYRRGADGEKNTLFMSCSMFGTRAENVAKFVRKGSLVAVEGRLNQRKYTRKSDGANMTVIETICDSVEFLEPKGAAPAETGYTPDITPESPSDDDVSIDVTDDDLPF